MVHKESPEGNFNSLLRLGSHSKDLLSNLEIWMNPSLPEVPKHPKVPVPARSDLPYSPGKADGNSVSKVPGCFSTGFYGSLLLTSVSSSYLLISKSTCVCQIWHSSQSFGSVINVSTCVPLQERFSLNFWKITIFLRK